MIVLIGTAYLNAPTPATTSVARMKSVAYATDDSASDDSTARPVTRDRRSWCARWEGIGLPSSSRFRPTNPESFATNPILYPDLARLVGAGAALSAVTLAYARWMHVTNATTVALSYLLIVLL